MIKIFDWPEVKDVVALVVDEKHSQFGRLASVHYHDWRETGAYSVSFPDGSTGLLNDGWPGHSRASTQVETFYRGTDEKFADMPGLVSLVERARFLGRSEQDLARDYKALFQEDFVLGAH